jgi:hypothetical protein
MQLVTASKVSIELLDIDWHKFPTNAKNGSRWKLNGADRTDDSNDNR